MVANSHVDGAVVADPLGELWKRADVVKVAALSHKSNTSKEQTVSEGDDDEVRKRRVQTSGR